MKLTQLFARFAAASIASLLTASVFALPTTTSRPAASLSEPLKPPAPAAVALPAPAVTPAPEQSESMSFGRMTYEKVAPSLVAVEYNYTSELGAKQFSAAGVVVSKDGLVLIPIGIVTPAAIADDQMKDFKIIVPGKTHDNTEIDAELQGRDERTGVAFVRPISNDRKWTPIHFRDEPVEVGDTVYSVGVLPKDAGYAAFLTTSIVSAKMRGPVPQVLVDGALAGAGAPVFNIRGDAIGFVQPRTLGDAMLDLPDGTEPLQMIYNPPKFYVPASYFLLSLRDPPTPQHPVELPWLGLMQLRGVDREMAEFFGLQDQPAIQIGDVVADGPSAKAGLKPSDIIVKMDGKPLERGDVPAELPLILTRQIQRMHIGEKVTFSVIHQQGQAPDNITVTLGPRPREFHQAHRFYARDIGLVVRDVLFLDTYERKLPATTSGVVVALLRPQGPAEAAKLGENDLITQFDGRPVQDLNQFKTLYEQARRDKPGNPMVLEVLQPDGREQTINIEPPQNTGSSGIQP